MPGGISSHACGTCKERHVKCDQTRPKCNNCRRLKLHCRPFRLTFKFVGQSQTEPWRPKTDSPICRSPHWSKRASSSSLTAQCLLGEPTFNVTFKAGFHTLTKSILPMYSVAYLRPHALESITTDSLRGSISQVLQGTSPLWTYMSLIPGRIGQSKALDDTANCLVQSVDLLPRIGHAAMIRECGRSYHSALQSIQSALIKYSSEPAPETICAVILLGVFESIAGASESSWLSHLAGLASLFKIRGPATPLTDIEMMILFSAGGGFLIEALLHDKECFLGEARWHEILVGDSRQNLHYSVYGWDLRLMMPYLCQIPGLMKECRALVYHHRPASSKVISDLVYRASEVRRVVLRVREYERWSTRTFKPRFQRKAVDSKQLFFHRDDLPICDYCNCLMGVAVVNRIVLAVSSCLEPLEEESLELSKTVMELYTSLGVHHELYSIHSLRVAQTVLTTTSAWKDKPACSGPDSSGQTTLIDPVIFEEFDNMICGRR